MHARFFSISLPIYLIAGVIAAAVLYPLLSMVAAALLPGGVIDFTAFQELFRSRGISTVVAATAKYVAGTAIVATLFGTVLAWINVRTDGGIKAVAGIIPLLPIMIPPLGSALGYLILFSPQGGVGNILIRSLFRIEATSGPFNVVSLWGMILVTGLTLAPVVYLVVSAALKNIDPALDEASRISGSGPWKTMRSITLPLILPAISSVALLVAVHGMSSFSSPFILGTGAGITPISVYIYRLFSTFPARTEVVIAASILLLLVVYLGTWLQARLSAGRSAVVGGKFSAPTLIKLGKWKALTRFIVCTYLVLSVLPLLGLVLGSLQPYLGASLSSLSFDNFRSVFSNHHTSSAIINSLRLGAGTATINIAVVGALLYFSQRFLTRPRWIEFTLMVPSVVPHIVIGVAFALTYSMSPFSLHGTLALVLIAYCVIFLPEAVRSANAALSQLNSELSEASHVFGAGIMRTFFRIVIPQVKGGMAAGWLIIFFMAVNEVTASTFLGGFNSAVIGYVAIDYFANGRLGQVATVTLVSTVITGGFVFLVSKLLKLNIAKV